MNYEDLTISAVRRLVEMLQRTSHNPDIIEAIVNQIELEPMPHDRVTIGSVIRLLNQTNGCTVLPEELAAQLNAPETISVEPDFWSTLSPERAMAIMGANMFGVADAIRHFGINPTARELAAMAQVPFTEKMLTACKDSHLLVAVFPLSIAEIKNRVTIVNFDIGNVSFPIADHGELKWYLVRKTLLPDSCARTWRGQLELLSQNEAVSTIQVMAYSMVGHYLATNERLFMTYYVNTSTRLTEPTPRHAYAGFQTTLPNTLHIGLYSANEAHARLGIAPVLTP